MSRGCATRVRCHQGVVDNKGGTAAPNWQCGLFGFFLLVLQQLYQSSYVFRGICLYHCHTLCNCCNCPAAFAAVALCSCCAPTLLLQASSMHQQLTELMRGGGPKAATQVQPGLSHLGGGGQACIRWTVTPCTNLLPHTATGRGGGGMFAGGVGDQTRVLLQCREHWCNDRVY